jgi:hypothetical protein
LHFHRQFCCIVHIQSFDPSHTPFPLMFGSSPDQPGNCRYRSRQPPLTTSCQFNTMCQKRLHTPYRSGCIRRKFYKII